MLGSDRARISLAGYRCAAFRHQVCYYDEFSRASHGSRRKYLARRRLLCTNHFCGLLACALLALQRRLAALPRETVYRSTRNRRQQCEADHGGRRSGVHNPDSRVYRRALSRECADARRQMDRLRQFRARVQRTNTAARYIFRSWQHVSAARLQGRRRQARGRDPDRAWTCRSYVRRGVGRGADESGGGRCSGDDRKTADSGHRSHAGAYGHRPRRRGTAVQGLQSRADTGTTRRAAGRCGRRVRSRIEVGGNAADCRTNRGTGFNPPARNER